MLKCMVNYILHDRDCRWTGLKVSRRPRFDVLSEKKRGVVSTHCILEQSQLFFICIDDFRNGAVSE